MEGEVLQYYTRQFVGIEITSASATRPHIHLSLPGFDLRGHRHPWWEWNIFVSDPDAKTFGLQFNFINQIACPTSLQYRLTLDVEDYLLKCKMKEAEPFLLRMSGSATISFGFENSPENGQESFPFKLIYHFQAIIFVSKWSNHHPVPIVLGWYFPGEDLYYFSLQYWFIFIKFDEARVLKSSNMNFISMISVLYN